jgi:hypothetical protein
VSDRVLFQLALWVVGFGNVTLWILWNNDYRRRWTQHRAREWQSVSGKFDEGAIVPRMGGRSGVGYEVRLGYDYRADGEQVGICKLPFYGVFSNEKGAEGCRQLVTNRNIAVHVSPRDPKRSAVLDEDVKLLLPRQVAPLGKPSIRRHGAKKFLRTTACWRI